MNFSFTSSTNQMRPPSLLLWPCHCTCTPSHKKIPPDKTTPFARCISRGAASAVGCGESCQLLLFEQASPKFIIIGYLSLTNLLDTHFFYTLFSNTTNLLINHRTSENNLFPGQPQYYYTNESMSHEWYHHLR